VTRFSSLEPHAQGSSPSAARPIEQSVLSDEVTTDRLARIDGFLAHAAPQTPFLVLDLDIVRAQYQALRAWFPFADIYYAVKANPSTEVIGALADLAASFDLASSGELERCRKSNIPADRLSFGNTIKREADIVQASASGVSLFALDSIAELEKLARAAPGARVFCRIAVDSRGAQWPLTHKFGCDAEMAGGLLLRAKVLGLRPAGVSFHVGSQQTDPSQWTRPIEHAARIFRTCARAGVELELLNLGGGLPARYRAAVPTLATYARTIEGALAASFGSSRPRIIIEPGRYLVGDAGVLRAQVLLVARKSQSASKRWVYLDAGRYNGLTETLGERIQYRLRTPRDHQACGPVILAGPTCDSTDVIYEKSTYELPLDLEIGDPIDFLSAGAYTASYASVEFNGFAPIRSYAI